MTVFGELLAKELVEDELELQVDKGGEGIGVSSPNYICWKITTGCPQTTVNAEVRPSSSSPFGTGSDASCGARVDASGGASCRASGGASG